MQSQDDPAGHERRVRVTPESVAVAVGVGMSAGDEELRREAFAFALELERSVPKLAKGMADYMAAAGTLSLIACIALMNLPNAQGALFLHRVAQAAFAFGGSTATAVGLMFANWFSAMGRREVWLRAAGHLPARAMGPFGERLLRTWHFACSTAFTLGASVAYGGFYAGGSFLLFEALVKSKSF